MRAIKFISGSIIAVVILLAIPVIIMTTMINPNDYKDNLNQYLYSKTGRHLIIKGNISWSFIPWLGFEVKQAELTNPAGFKGPNLASIGKVKAKVRFWPLLTGKVELGKVIIDHANINLIKGANGKTNWGNINNVNNSAQRVLGVADNKNIMNSSINLPVKQLNIAEVDVEDSTINLIDQKTNRKTQLSDFNLTADTVSLGKNFPIKMKFLLQENDSKTKVATKASATANINLKNQLYKLNKLTIKAKVERPELPIILVNLNGDLVANLARQTVVLSPLKLKFVNMDVQGRLQIKRLSQTPAWATTLVANDVSLEPLVKNIRGKSFIKGDLSFKTTLTTEGSNPKALLQHLNGKGDIDVSNGALIGLNINAFVDQAEAIIQQKTVTLNPQPMQTPFASLSGTYTIHNGVLNNNDLKLASDKIDASGSGTVNLTNDIINYTLTTEYHKKMKNQTQFELPIIITGNLSNPSIKPNYSDLAKKVLGHEIKDKLKQYSRSFSSLLEGL